MFWKTFWPIAIVTTLVVILGAPGSPAASAHYQERVCEGVVEKKGKTPIPMRLGRCRFMNLVPWIGEPIQSNLVLELAR